jgi:hypothetical protein
MRRPSDELWPEVFLLPMDKWMLLMRQHHHKTVLDQATSSLSLFNGGTKIYRAAFLMNGWKNGG